MLLVLFLLPTTISSAASQTSPLAIKGYDPVAYFTTGKPTPGVPEFRHEWSGHLYQFSRSDHLERFKAEPARYAPQFGNYCAMALSKAKLVVADPENWLISDGKASWQAGASRTSTLSKETSPETSPTRNGIARSP